MIAINKHQISIVTLLLYTPAGPNGHIQPTCVFPRSIFHPTTLSKIPVMWLKKRDSIKSLIKTLKKKIPTSKVIWNNFTMCYKIVNNKDITFFPKCCWHFVWWSSVIATTCNGFYPKVMWNFEIFCRSFRRHALSKNR